MLWMTGILGHVSITKWINLVKLKSNLIKFSQFNSMDSFKLNVIIIFIIEKYVR